jgi:hypothetical protein
MSSQDFLVSLETTSPMSARFHCIQVSIELKRDGTYAPPELSEPAMTSTRGVGILSEVVLSKLHGLEITHA